jgi:hypothetical protein
MKSNIPQGILGFAGVTALTMASMAAHASCADMTVGSATSAAAPMAPFHMPQKSAEHRQRETAAEDIVGTWYVSYTSGGAPFAQAFIQWHDDHTEWESINRPVLSGNICVGSWKALDRTHVYRNHYGWIYSNGTVSNYFNETETDEVAPDGNSYNGINRTIIYGLDGSVVADVPGTSTARRIAP